MPVLRTEGTTTLSARCLIHEGEMERMARWVADFSDLETGGDLFGFWTHSGFPSVQFVLGPGPRSRRTSTSFFQDRDHLLCCGQQLLDHHGLQHIGEWHSHHSLGLAEPSSGDEATVVRAMRDNGLAQFLLVIANRPKARARVWNVEPVSLRAYLFRATNGYRCEPAAWVVFPGHNPFRNDSRLRPVSNLCTPRSMSVTAAPIPMVSLAATAAPQRKAEFRDGSWLNTQEGLELLKYIVTELQRWTRPRLLRSPEGLLELRIPARNEEMIVTFGNDTRRLAARVLIDGDKELRGSVDDILEAIRRQARRQYGLLSCVWNAKEP